MTSPKKNVDTEKDNTMFGDLMAIEKQTAAMNAQMITDIQNIKKLQNQFTDMQKQAKKSLQESSNKSTDQIKQFQQRIKNYLVAQKAQYMRFANQINQMIQNSKQINSQLTLLGNRFDEFQKNVGL